MSETPVLDFDCWLATGTVAQRTIELHNDRAVADELDRLDKRREIAAKAAAREGSIDDDYGLAAIDAEYDALWQRWQDGKETWLLRAVSDEEIKAIAAAHPVEKMPVPPEEPKKNSPAGAVAKYQEDKAEHDRLLTEWGERAIANRTATNLHHLSWAIVSVTTSRGVAKAQGETLVDGEPNPDFRPAITTAQLAALGKRGRQQDVTTLYAAAVEAVTKDLEPAVPFSQRASENAPA